MSNLLQQLNADLAAVIVQARRSLVKVHSSNYGAGAGTILGKDGLIITNSHVIRQGPVEITLPNDDRLPAQIVANDPELDLAALAIDVQNLPALFLGDSQSLQPGQLVIALGHPWGVAGAVSVGPVIAVGRPPEMPQRAKSFVQAGLQLRPGHSGGPMIDFEGHLVGLNTMITGPKVGLAVPASVIREFVTQRVYAAPAAGRAYI